MKCIRGKAPVRPSSVRASSVRAQAERHQSVLNHVTVTLKGTIPLDCLPLERLPLERLPIERPQSPCARIAPTSLNRKSTKASNCILRSTNQTNNYFDDHDQPVLKNVGQQLQTGSMLVPSTHSSLWLHFLALVNLQSP